MSGVKLKNIHVVCSYTIFADGDVELPDGKTTEDIETCFVKYGSFRCIFKDGTEFEKEIGSATFESVDWKYPASTKIYAIGEDGIPVRNRDFAEELGRE